MAQQAVTEQRLQKQGARARWVFTINNYSSAEEDLVKALAQNCKYAICGREVGESGTPHLQGFLNLKKKMRFNAVKNALGGRCHLEPARGDDCQNRDYCSKGGDILCEEGEPVKERQRTDLTTAVKLLTETRDLTHVASACPEVFVKFHRGLKELLLYHPDMMQQRAWKTKVTVYCGSPGVGKSRLVYEMAPKAYWKPRGRWWDGYNFHEDVVLDDFYGWLPFDDLLRLCDRYPLRVETKGGTMSMLAKHIWITSNRLPHEWYGEDIPNKDALYRRIDELFLWTGTEFAPPPHHVFPHRICY